MKIHMVGTKLFCVERQIDKDIYDKFNSCFSQLLCECTYIWLHLTENEDHIMNYKICLKHF
jgi:hypothetical protein